MGVQPFSHWFIFIFGTQNVTPHNSRNRPPHIKLIFSLLADCQHVPVQVKCDWGATFLAWIIICGKSYARNGLLTSCWFFPCYLIVDAWTGSMWWGVLPFSHLFILYLWCTKSYATQFQKWPPQSWYFLPCWLIVNAWHTFCKAQSHMMWWGMQPCSPWFIFYFWPCKKLLPHNSRSGS